ncbi:unnamed protein product [Phaedon cochleariae]|uniref:DNA replication ATP-dependent helicase/nuclease DNA2 n=1 Tax=Phaedon cochleariae TaxID=80249 RepID=A0A9N9X3Y3_PHACE|nr:unnamed protein product [Phaedon cochleariae]
MKKTTQSKVVQQVTGNSKISSFFSKITKSRLSSDLQRSKNNTVVLQDSDDDFVDSPNHSSRPNRENRRVGDKENNSTKNNSKKTETKKRKVDEMNGDNPPHKKSNASTKPKPLSPKDQSITEKHQPGNVTPSKQMIFIKSPEHLLSPEALRIYHTPEKEQERIQDRIRTPTSKKLLFNNDEQSPSSNGSKNTNPLIFPSTSSVMEDVKSPPYKLNRTPKKESVPKSPRKTPNKVKRTPKKLFEKSPDNLNKFNVQVIADFIKITPSKSNINPTEDDDVIFVKSTDKIQSSILKFVSPVASNSSLKAKQQNESTPKKNIENEFTLPTDKIRTKLDFADCVKIVPKESVEITPKNKSPEKSHETQGKIDLTDIYLDFDDNWEEDILKDLEEYNLDLTKSHHCEIVSINPFPTKSVLTLKSTKSGEKAICNLQGFWVHTMLGIGDIVHVTAKQIGQEWIVDNDVGLLVYEPDLLISTTSVVNSLWCKRRSVLTERFRGFEPSNKQMLVGTLVHSLLQFVLRNKVSSDKQMVAIVKNLIKERKIMKDLYECGVSLQTVETEVIDFIPKIHQFISLYLTTANVDSNRIKNKEDWKGMIQSIDDIEENIWCPELGVKGKVDVSIKTDHHSMPLELKTGRATVSLEHKGQVMLYIMMMKKMGYNVPSGLLLYLREGVLREITATQKEKRDIMLLRNDLTYYLTRPPKIVENEGVEKKLLPPELPAPINHPSCQKCPYNVICTSYAKYSDENISKNKILKNIQDEALEHITESHLNYIMKWVTLLALEANSDKQAKDVRQIYTLTPQEREINGKCIINLKITHIADECDGVFEHSFERINADFTCNFFSNGIVESNYVVISTNSRPAVATGFVTNITATTISVTLDRNLNKKYSNKTFHIDSYDSSSIQSYNLASLTLLLDISQRGEELRSIIIDKKPPTFKKALPKSIGTKGKEILRKLNIVQQRAVLRAIAANEYFLIKGMPGTGKTATIVALIQLLYEMDKSVLITSHTHSAVDNVCIKLLDCGVKLMKLGSESRMHPKLRACSENSLTKHCNTPEELEKVYNSMQIVAVTCLGSGHPLLTKRSFDICIVDESTQVLQSSVIRPLHAAKTFVLIGDPDQLPAVVISKEAKEMGMSESLFERLYQENAVTSLNLNYRMNRRITEVANGLTYNGELLIGNEMVANATLKYTNKEIFTSCQNWISSALDSSLENSVQFLDTGPVWNLEHNVPWMISKNDSSGQNDNDHCVNIYETAVTLKLVQTLLKAGVPATEIGVIATYRRQVAQISALIQCEHLDVSTVDQFQGKDKSVIIYSCAKSRDTSKHRVINKFELLEDHQRITVAITRSKHKLIIIGDVQTIAEYSTFKKLLPILQSNIIRLPETEGFQWESVLDISV